MARQSHKQDGVGGVMARLLSPYGHRQGARRATVADRRARWCDGATTLALWPPPGGASRRGTVADRRARWRDGATTLALWPPPGGASLRVTVTDRRARWRDGATTLALWPPPGGRSGHSGLMGKAQC